MIVFLPSQSLQLFDLLAHRAHDKQLFSQAVNRQAGLFEVDDLTACIKAAATGQECVRFYVNAS